MPFIEKNIQKIRLAFSLKKKYVKNIKNIILEVRNCNSVCLNVRRGDLLNYKDANVLPIEYYKKAVKIMDKRVSNPTYYITSDEIEWCKSNFDWLKNKRFLDHDGYENLEIGKNCKHNILANSTFSWWAGMLNSNPHKIVICPKKFYIRAMDKNDIQTPFPIGWVSID
jgi:hypothetical protein